MRIALVTNPGEKVSEVCNILTKMNNEVSIVTPLTDPLSTERETAPFYRCDLVLYYSKTDWCSLIPTMRRVWGIAAIEPEDDKCGEVSGVAGLCIPPSKLDPLLNNIPPYLHWYNRSITEILNISREMDFDFTSISERFSEVLDLPMSMNQITCSVRNVIESEL